MRSHLTRHVFRRLIANEPLIHRGCVRRQRYSSTPGASRPVRIAFAHHGSSAVQHSQRRTFLNFNIFNKRQEVREPDMDPGIDKMMELAKRERMQARLPPPEEIASAFEMFFNDRAKKFAPITDSQAQLALQSLRYCGEMERLRRAEGQGSAHYIRTHVLVAATQTISRSDSPASSHIELAGDIYTALKTSKTPSYQTKALISYLHALTRTGSTREARDVLIDFETPRLERGIPLGEVREEKIGDDESQMLHVLLAKAWAHILRGFVTEGSEADIERTLELIAERQYTNRAVTVAMLTYCLDRSDPHALKDWWRTYVRQATELSNGSDQKFANNLGRVLRWCMEHNELETGHQIMREVMAMNPQKFVWDEIFVWAAGTKKSVDEIDRMIGVMEQLNGAISDSTQWRKADATTINTLLDFAISKNDPYMAERYITLGRDRNIEPDARTYVLQMDYRLSVNDVDGALAAYKDLQSMDLSSNGDVPTSNRLIVALCRSGRHDFDTIMNVAADLSDRRVRFEWETTTALSLLHFSRDERDDVLDLLNTHAFHYSSTERKGIRDAIVAYCVDPNTLTSRSWQGYTVLKTVFDELPRPERTELMTSFLNRGRADMGVHVFQNMRSHSREDTVPTIDTYVAAFMGLAKLRDLENLEIVHNLLKIDYNIDVNTYLNNALIIGYTACGKPRKALDFWTDIIAGREGPSYNSIHATLRACEKAPWGDVQAQRVWSLLRQRGVELDHALWSSYAGALTGNGDLQLAIGTIEEAESKGELEVDFFVLGSLFNGASGQTKQAEIEAWGKQKYPEAWSKLESFGTDFDENFMRTIRIDRKVSP